MKRNDEKLTNKKQMKKRIKKSKRYFWYKVILVEFFRKRNGKWNKKPFSIVLNILLDFFGIRNLEDL